MAWGLDTGSFLNAFTGFTSRRGVPEIMNSDNDTSFVRAVNELKEVAGQLDKDKIQIMTAQKGVKWVKKLVGIRESVARLHLTVN